MYRKEAARYGKNRQHHALEVRATLSRSAKPTQLVYSGTTGRELRRQKRHRYRRDQGLKGQHALLERREPTRRSRCSVQHHKKRSDQYRQQAKTIQVTQERHYV